MIVGATRRVALPGVVAARSPPVRIMTAAHVSHRPDRRCVGLRRGPVANDAGVPPGRPYIVRVTQGGPATSLWRPDLSPKSARGGRRVAVRLQEVAHVLSSPAPPKSRQAVGPISAGWPGPPDTAGGC